MTHNDDQESHLNTPDAQLTHSAFNINEIVCKRVKTMALYDFLLQIVRVLSANLFGCCSVEYGRNITFNFRHLMMESFLSNYQKVLYQVFALKNSHLNTSIAGSISH